MISRLTTVALTLFVGVVSVPHLALAQDYDMETGPSPGYPPQQGYDDDDGGPPPPPRHAHACNLDDAEDEARDMGFHRPHVIDVDPRRVVVEGFTHHGPDRIYFANVRGCPVIGR
jgi:hypothetical protein